jgi:hypothetical protein
MTRLRLIPSLIAALTIALVTAPYWLFFDRDDEEEPEPLPEELVRAATDHAIGGPDV